MPRWLITFVLAIVLSCYGMAALAHSATNLSHEGGSVQTQVDAAALPDGGDGVPAETSDKALSQGEAGFDHTEAVDVGHWRSAPFPLSEPTPGIALTTPPSPFLERPTRPPRGTAFTA